MSFSFPFRRTHPLTTNWTRRDVLTTIATHSGALAAIWAYHPLQRDRWLRDQSAMRPDGSMVHHSPTHEIADPAHVQALARHAVEAAQAAGARYADARLTRAVYHQYRINAPALFVDSELVGLGVRVLVNGSWGFAAAPFWIGDSSAPDAAVAIARDAVQLAKATAGAAKPVELIPAPVVTGTWSTPLEVDPFRVPIEEKLAMLFYWNTLASRAGVSFFGWPNYLHFVREERTLATSEGTLVSQTVYESGAKTNIGIDPYASASSALKALSQIYATLNGLNISGQGWEVFDAADISGQFETIGGIIQQKSELKTNTLPGDVGRYTVVCDGATMASIVENTIGIATQLDRGLGYEANAGGTSFINDPLQMVGTFQLASDAVTVTANRNVPTQLATVKWDGEGIEPQPTTLVRQGVLTDFQTTREQAAWLVPYYRRVGQPIRSHGYAAAQDALSTTMQHMPNLSLEPDPKPISTSDLIAGVQDGILIENAEVIQVDFQGRTGIVGMGSNPMFSMRRIKNGRMGATVEALALMFDAINLWKNVSAIGGTETRTTISTTHFNNPWGVATPGILQKGEPGQSTSHSVQAVAAVIANQPFINPFRRA